MKIEDVKVGTRVELKYVNTVDTLYGLREGKAGTIIEDGTEKPCISWDYFTGGHSDNPNNLRWVKENSVLCVNIEQLERIGGGSDE